MRYWNVEDLSEREEELLDIWLDLIDDVESYQSTRLQLRDSIDDLILSLNDENFGEFKDSYNQVQNLVDQIPNKIFSDIVSDLESELPDLEEVEDNREELQNAFRKTVEFDTEPIFDELEDWWIDNDTVNELRGRLYSQTSDQADAHLFSTIKEESTESNLNEIRSDISSKRTADDYILYLSSRIERFLEEKEEHDRENLKSLIVEIFAELQLRSWRDKDFEEVIRQYITVSDPSLKSKQQDFLTKIRDEAESQKCYVGLPEAHLGSLTPIKVGGVTFNSVSDNNFNIHSRKDPNFADLDFIDDTDVWASAEVAGATSRIAVRKLKEKVARAVDILNLGKKVATLKFPFDESYTVLKESQEGNIMPLRGKNDLSKVAYSELASKEDIEKRTKHFESYLLGSPESSLEESIASSIRWYRYASRSPEEEERFLKYIISLESLLVKGKLESKKDTIVERAVDFLQLHTEHRQKYSFFFSDVYDVRSQIVHSGARNLPEFESQLDKLENIVSELIANAQDYTEHCESIEEVLQEVRREEKEIKQEKIEESPFEIGEPLNFEAILATEGGSEIATIQLNGEFVDDGMYVYYEADVEDGEYRTGLQINSGTDYKLKIKTDDGTYIGSNVVFPNENVLEVFPNKLPTSIRWYQIEKDGTS